MVRGCRGERTNMFASEEGMDRVEYAVCQFHLQALSEGEPWMMAPDPRDHEILVGNDLAPEVLNAGWAQHRRGEAVVNLSLGRDGVEEQNVTFRVSPDKAKLLAEMLGMLAK
jgi:hypothetical protein